MGFTDETTTKAGMGNLLRPQNISALLTSPVLKEVIFMCLLTIILTVLLAIAFALAIVIIIGGTGFAMVFGDVIVAILVVLFVIKLISKK